MFTSTKLSAVLLAIALLSSPADAAANPKIQGALRRNLRSDTPSDIVVNLKGGNSAALKGHEAQIRSFQTRGQRTSAVVEALVMNAKESQRNVFQFLNDFNEIRATESLPTRSFWITNQVFIKGANGDLIESLAGLDEVESIRPPHVITLAPTIEGEEIPRNSSVEWGVSKVQADQVWETGNKGEGVLVGNIDTGVRVTHEALSHNFVGEHGWLDPYDNTQTPYDGNGHGTHVMGTIAGGKGIGVAPGAKWMACRGCGTSSCSEEALLGCAEFVACPTDPNGENPDCTKAPHVINNSWGGGQGDSWFQDVVNAWHAAGIIPVFANGNDGPSCGTAGSPADMKNVIAVGSTTVSDQISSFSSKGPSITGLLKPEISAPGSNIRSAIHIGDDRYASLSGTSMATPHVVGVIALMISANPQLSFEKVLEIVTATPDQDTLQSSGMTCGDLEDTVFPNNVFGFGRINAKHAVDVVGGSPLPTPAPTPIHPDECNWSWDVLKLRLGCQPRDHCKWSWKKMRCFPKQV